MRAILSMGETSTAVEIPDRFVEFVRCPDEEDAAYHDESNPMPAMWTWDLVGWAIVQAGAPWNEHMASSGKEIDFHDVPESAWYDLQERTYHVGPIKVKLLEE